ncbi:MAG: FKBP-type peptidyl-prolyl cis-trans isomerase [Pseudomonas sp.]
MKHLFIFGLLFCACSFVLHAQNKKTSSTEEKTIPAFSTTSSGLQYKIIKDSAGTNYPEAGGYITFWFEMRTSSDSTYDNQFLDAMPVGMPTPQVRYKPSVEEGFLLLTDGDSALFVLNADSLYANSFQKETPAFLPKGSSIHLIIKMVKVYSKQFVDSVMAAERAFAKERAAVERKAYYRDSIAIQTYLTDHNLKGEAIGEGIYIVKLKKRSEKSPYIVKGEIVETKYIVNLLIEGTEVDRSEAGQYFEFTVGFGEVIKGWDYAFQRLKLGEKALILIPSGLAYGSSGGFGIIPPNAPLLFEVEIKK